MMNQEKIREELKRSNWRQKETNMGLWLSRYVQDQKEEESRRNVMNEVWEYMPEPEHYAAAFARWERILEKDYHVLQPCEAKVRGRMIVGLGSESVLETSICLHRTYGMPYIPGSALKGLAASYAHQRLGKKWQKDQSLHNLVFGNTEEAGYITFFDAWYLPSLDTGGIALFPDVITVHHQKYYQGGGAAPSDTDDPIPIPFLSASGSYLLALAAPDLDSTTGWLDVTYGILTQALGSFGIGARTSSGYGRMEVRPHRWQGGTSQNVEPIARIRPELPVFKDGQNISGVVVSATDDLRKIAPPGAKAFLSYEAFSTRDLVIVVEDEESSNWIPGNTRKCVLIKQISGEDCTILMCRPRTKR